jgi:hypothetical protein
MNQRQPTPPANIRLTRSRELAKALCGFTYDDVSPLTSRDRERRLIAAEAEKRIKLLLFYVRHHLLQPLVEFCQRLFAICERWEEVQRIEHLLSFPGADPDQVDPYLLNQFIINETDIALVKAETYERAI